jgi:hypothetical protein
MAISTTIIPYRRLTVPFVAGRRCVCADIEPLERYATAAIAQLLPLGLCNKLRDKGNETGEPTGKSGERGPAGLGGGEGGIDDDDSRPLP